MAAFNVKLNGKNIDTVFYTMHAKQTIADACDMVRDSLINHDGLDPAISVNWPRGQRVTVDSWELEGNYGQGWELLCAATSRREIFANKKDYQENAPCPLRIVKRRERV